MPSTPSDRLRIELQARGENVNSWGDTRLNDAFKRVEEAVAGVLTLTITGDTVLTSANYTVDQARMGTLVLTGTPAANFRVTIPGVQKTYNVINLTPRIANFGVADMATVSVRAGLSNLVVCDGAVTRVVDLTLDQIRTAAAAVNLGGQRLTNLGQPATDADAISRGQALELLAPQVTRAQEWANKTGAVVDAGEYSSKEYAAGTAAPAGSARRWAIGPIGDGSAKDWATLLSAIVAASEYSAKEYAVGATTPLGSAKRWATATGVVADGLLGARGYANNSASSAQTSTDQAEISTNKAGESAGSAKSAADRLADFNNRYVVAAQFPTTGNFAGRLAFATDGNQFGVYDSGTGAYQTITIPSQATETTAGLVRLATAAEALDGATTQAVLTPARVRSAAGVRYRARTSNIQLTASDNNALIDATGTFAQTFDTPANLGANWYLRYKNAGTGNITIPASDGRTNWIMYPGEMRLFQCDGTTLRSEVLWPFSVAFTTNTVFVPPPGYAMFRGFGWGGGGGGFNASDGNTNFGFGGSLGGSGAITIRSEQLSPSENVTIGAGGAAGTSSSRPGQAGGATTIGSFAFAGGFGGATSSQGSAMRSPIGANLVEGQGAPGIPASINVPGLPGMVPGGGGQGSSNSFAAAAGARGELRLWGVV